MSHRLYRPLSTYSPTFSSEAGAAVWLGSGGQMMRPCSSNFIPRARPLFTRISFISFSDLWPEVFGFRISFLLFFTRSPIGLVFVVFLDFVVTTQTPPR